ncbi:MAG: hypothetical protein SF069_10805 [Phycisphaerae bacterium]|nr:hypothetical protein [Phycisphaerae bacterium]
MSEAPKRTYPIDMMGLIISALVALYFSYSWSIDAPPVERVSPEAAKTWFLFDQIYRWGLFIGAVALVGGALIAGASGATSPIVRLLALAEGSLGVVFAAMAIDTLLETRGFDLSVLLTTILALYCFRAARDFWLMVRNAED